MYKTVKIVILSVIAAALIVLVVWGITARNLIYFSHGRLQFGEQQEGQGVSQTEFETNVQGIQNIKLDFVSEQIDVVATNEDIIRIEETSSSELRKEDMMRCSVIGNTLVAESGLKDHWINFFNFLDYADIKVTLYVPSAYQNNFDLGSVSGEINMQDATADALELHTTSGSIEVSNVQSDTLDMDSVSGELTAEGGSFEKVTADTVSGEINLEAQRMNEIKANSTSGEVNAFLNEMPARVDIDTISGSAKVAIPENDGFTVKYDSVSGDFNCDFALAHDTYKEGGSDISVDTVSGSIDIIKK